MRYLNAKIRELNLKEWQRRSASEDDFRELIQEDCVVNVNGLPAIAYIANIRNKQIDLVRECVQKIKYSKSTRTSGLITNSRIFGYAPRNVLRGHPCRSTSLAIESPVEHKAVCGAAKVIDQYYKLHFKDTHERHEEQANNVSEAWMIPDSVFTSGIINHNNPLQYHFDSGNFSNVCSAMIGFRHKTHGGYLSCPELDIGFEIGDRSLILFDGQSLLHGVTPIKRSSEDSYRITVVYYSLKQMWNCKTSFEELDLLRNRRTSIETKRSGIKNNSGDDS